MTLILGAQQPRTSFGELSTAEPTPVIQAVNQYGVSSKLRTLNSGTGSAIGTTNGEVSVSSGTDVGGFASAFTSNALHYRAGQGIASAFTGRFDTGAVGNNMTLGLTNATDSVEFGYIGADFGCIRQHHGAQQIEELTITTASTVGGNCTLTLNGTGYSVALAGGASKLADATAIADYVNANIPLWNAQAVWDGADNKVIIREVVARAPTGAYSLASGSPSTGVAGTFSTIQTGASRTLDFTNINATNGVDVSSWLNPQNGNVFRVQMQYLGYGQIIWEVEDPNTGLFVPVHYLKYANSATQPSLRNPTLRVGAATGNSTGTTSKTLYNASMVGQIEGKDTLNGLTRAQSVSKSVSTEIPLLSILNRSVYGNIVNLGDIIPQDLSISNEGTKTVTIYLKTNATLTGVRWDYVDETSSIALVDTNATAVAGGELVDSYTIAPGTTLVLELGKRELKLLPENSLTLSAAASTGTHVVDASGDWKEDL
jgi:hypothetical protein